MTEKTEEVKPVENTEAVDTVAVETEPTIEIDVNGQLITWKQTTRSKGRGAGKPLFLIDPTDDLPGVINKVRLAVGDANFYRAVYTDVIRPYCGYATAESTPADGEPFVDSVLASSFLNQWISPTRKHTVGIKELKEKYAELVEEVSPFIEMQVANKLVVGTPDHNRMLQLFVALAELNGKIEERSRSGKKKTKEEKEKVAA